MIKNISLILFLFLVSGNLFAQINFEAISLKEAAVKAKKENKLVLVVCSATWCGPCKMMEQHIYPRKEVGDYINSNFISIKYYLDKTDPDSLKKRITAYPTYLFFDGNEEEVSRFCGTNGYFVTMVKEATAPENQWKARAQRLIDNPDYTVLHAKHLNSVGMGKEGLKLLNDYFATKTVKENFSKEKIDIYAELITNINSPILKSMVENEKEVVPLVGQDFYTTSLHTLITTIIFNRGLFHSSEELDKIISFIKTYPSTKSGLARLLLSSKDAIINKDGVKMCENALKVMDKFTPDELEWTRWLYTKYKKDGDQTEVYKKFLTRNIELEKDPSKLDYAKQLLNEITSL